MSRSEKSRKVGLMGTLIALLISAGLVVGAFSLLPHTMLQGDLPLDISSTEAAKYAELADVRRVERQLKEPQGEAFILGGSKDAGECLYDQNGAGWVWRWFEAPGYGDSVQVRPTTSIDGGYEIRFKELAPFRGQAGIILSPASPQDIRMKYAEILAGELGLASPSISYVRLVACGKEQRTHMVEEVIGEGFLGRRRFSEAILLSRSFDPDNEHMILPDVIGDTAHAAVFRSVYALLREEIGRGRLDRMAHTIDGHAAAGWFLMHWMEGAPDPLYQENYFAFQWARGKIIPLHRSSRSRIEEDTIRQGDVSFNLITPWARVPAFQETFKNVRDGLGARKEEIMAAFAAADSACLPVLANEAPSSEVRATADRIREQLMDRLVHGDALGSFDRPMVDPPGLATLLKGQEVAKRYWPTESDADVIRSIAERYKARIHGDSIVFGRGKYFIDEDIVLPKGYGVIMLSGARITMAPDRNILVQGPLHIRGSRLNPVFIRPGGGAFGAIAVMGDGDTECTVNGLQISGGRGARINGVQYPAMLSINDVASLRSRDCIFSDPAGEMALFVQGGDLRMEENVMYSSTAEIRDATGSLMNCTFQRGAQGLVLNTSKLTIEGGGFSMIKGIALSATDGSKVLVKGSRFDQCGTAIAAADLSEVHVLENVVTGNRLAFSAKRTKPLYGGAKIFIYGNDLQRNTTERDADEHSSITNADRYDERVMENGSVQ